MQLVLQCLREWLGTEQHGTHVTDQRGQQATPFDGICEKTSRDRCLISVDALGMKVLVEGMRGHDHATALSRSNRVVRPVSSSESR